MKAFKESGAPPVSDAKFQAVGEKAGKRPADVLKIQRADIHDGPLWIVQNKAGAKRAIEVTGELAALIEQSRARPGRASA